MPKQYKQYKKRLEDIRQYYTLNNVIQADALVQVFIKDILTDIANNKVVSPYFLAQLAIIALEFKNMSVNDVNYG